MNDIEAKEKVLEIIKQLITFSYSQIFDISPLERDLSIIHMNNPNIAEPLIGMMFCAIMLGKKDQAIDCGNKAWNIKNNLPDNIEMLYADCLINVGEFEKARILISAKMDNLEENLDLFFNTVVKYALYTGELYILDNLAKYPEIYMSEPLLFDFAKKYYTGINNKHYHAILKIINDTVGKSVCSVEYLLHNDGNIQLCLYTSSSIEENNKNQDIIFEKIDGYYLSMQEKIKREIFIRLDNINIHPQWW